MIKFGDTVKASHDLPRIDGLLFVTGHKFTVMDIHDFEGQIFCDLQDADFETLKWVNVSHLIEADIPKL